MLDEMEDFKEEKITKRSDGEQVLVKLNLSWKES